jgi:hypothetical protein
MPGQWTWSDAMVFIAVITSMQLVMFWLLTTVFLGMLTQGDRCPVCDAETSAVERRGWWHVVSYGVRNRRSWCVQCGWEGILRRSDAWVSRERERQRAWKEVRARQSRSRAVKRANP